MKSYRFHDKQIVLEIKQKSRATMSTITVYMCK